MTTMKTNVPDKELTGVRAKLAAQKNGDGATSRKETLPKSGIEVQIPNFFNHKNWMVAQRQAKGDAGRAQAALIAATVMFEGEKFTLADVLELLDARDVLFLVAEIFGDDDEEDGVEGNDLEA